METLNNKKILGFSKNSMVDNFLLIRTPVFSDLF